MNNKSYTTVEDGINIGLEREERSEIADLLHKILADQHVLYMKTRNFHWNVTGQSFMELHLLFERQYNELAEAIDETAEKIRSIGAVAEGTMAKMLELARLKEHKGELLPSQEMITILLSDHESVIAQLREDIETCEENNDKGTAEFVTGLLNAHEKTAWMLRAYLGK